MIPVRQPLTKEHIFKKITSYDIFKHYCKDFIEVGKKFQSDLPGRKDSIPSCVIEFIGGDLLYSDFGYKTGLRAVPYMMEKYGLSYGETLEKINNDFGLELGTNKRSTYNHTTKSAKSVNFIPKFQEKSPSILKKKQREFTEADLKYWEDFYWTKDMLNAAKTQSISHYWINNAKFIVKPDELAFSYEYYWHNGRAQRKLYFPDRDKFKWFSNVDDTIVQLVDVAPKQGDILVITSSKKDAGIFWRMCLDNALDGKIIHGVAPNTENSFVPEKWFYKASKRFKKVILWYNNDWNRDDNPGILNAKKYSEIYNIPFFYTPDNTAKDPSDFAKKYGLGSFISYFNSIV